GERRVPPGCRCPGGPASPCWRGRLSLVIARRGAAGGVSKALGRRRAGELSRAGAGLRAAAWREVQRAGVSHFLSSAARDAGAGTRASAGRGVARGRGILATAQREAPDPRRGARGERSWQLAGGGQ